MGNYENGAFTRRAIVDACKKLFYEKGYHETSYADICEEAHVNRGTIYYHFPSKELLRLEAQWEYYIECKHIAEQYCPDEQYVPLVAMAIFDLRMQKDANLRSFGLQICKDYPVFTGKKDLTYFYYSVYDYMWNRFWDVKKISPLSFTTVYGYLKSCIHMLCEYPESYDAFELTEYLYRTCLNLWGAPNDLIDEIITKEHAYVAVLPKDVWKISNYGDTGIPHP